MSNLFISYQINDENQDYDLLKKVINTLGNMTQLHDTCWYVNSHVSAEEATKRIGSAVMKDATLVVVDASNNTTHWIGLDDPKATRVRQNWHMDLDNIADKQLN